MTRMMTRGRMMGMRMEAWRVEGWRFEMYWNRVVDTKVLNNMLSKSVELQTGGWLLGTSLTGVLPLCFPPSESRGAVHGGRRQLRDEQR